MKATHKSVEFSYPTSDNAKRFGRYWQGGWTVREHVGKWGVPKAVAMFATRAEAQEHADKLPLKTAYVED